MYGELRIVDDVPEAFAEFVVEEIDAAERFSMALSGGSTARDCYERLAAKSMGRVDWRRVEIFWGDERCVAPESPDANEQLVREALLSRVEPVGAVHPLRCSDGADAYEALLRARGGVDLIHLGVGPDGHTASLFPGSPALAAPPGRLVTTNVDPSGRNPFERITVTFEAIALCRVVVFTVAGGAKRPAMQALADGADLPAARVRGPRVVWLVDRAAAPAS
jgi:6-phosphogluconolactonase